MATMEQIKRGMMSFVDEEILAKMPMGLKKVALATGFSLAIENADKTLRKNIDHPIIKMLGVIDGDTIDIDQVASVMTRYISDEGFKQNVSLMGISFGDMVFRKSDVENIRSRILNA